ncbi:MAG TPA: HD domain-containing protein, partial [Thermomicrobiales bacterium]|nr:HD domain-containing protein [Thermomicrobiales bacterium]
MGQVEQVARERAAANDAAHDAAHLARVVANARRLVAAEMEAGRPVDPVVVEVAAWLHDIVALPKGQGASGEAARRSADEARVILRDRRADDAFISAVAHAVEAHSFSGEIPPETVDARIVQDADRLDALGAIGIARLWVTGATLGGQLYHPDDPLGVSRELGDRGWGLDHIERKLLRLPALMQTEAGRVEAERRAEFVRRYRDELLREIGAEIPSPLERQ